MIFKVPSSPDHSMILYPVILGTTVELFTALQQFFKPLSKNLKKKKNICIFVANICLLSFKVLTREIWVQLSGYRHGCSGRKRQAEDVLLGDGEAGVVLACSFNDSSEDPQSMHSYLLYFLSPFPRWMPSCRLYVSWRRRNTYCRAVLEQERRSWVCEHRPWK